MPISNQERAEELLNKLETDGVSKGRGFANWDFMLDQITQSLDQKDQESEKKLEELRKKVQTAPSWQERFDKEFCLKDFDGDGHVNALHAASTARDIKSFITSLLAEERGEAFKNGEFHSNKLFEDVAAEARQQERAASLAMLRRVRERIAALYGELPTRSPMKKPQLAYALVDRKTGRIVWLDLEKPEKRTSCVWFIGGGSGKGGYSLGFEHPVKLLRVRLVEVKK